MEKIKVAISAIWYPMAMATYFWRAFERRNDVELCVVGPFTGAWIPWNGGMYLPQKYVRIPTIPLPIEALRMEVRPELIYNQLPWRPNIWIQFDAGWHFVERPWADIVAHVQTDPHVLKERYIRPKRYSDINFCMQYSYMQEGEVFLPYAFDPMVHYPMPHIEKVYDACLIGLHYENRNSLISLLQQRGATVRYGIGEIFDEYRLAYNQSKVAVSWSSLLDVPARVFEAMGMGLPLVANRIPDMSIFFKEGRDYLGFDTVEEGADQTMNLLKDDKFRSNLAFQGHTIIQQHTWDNRVEQILREAKLV